MNKNIPEQRTAFTIRKAPIVLGLFFLGLLLIGIAIDEPSHVLEQAKQICLNCIGIG
ncbi:MAG: hypothetical protein OEL55_00505 [Desulfobulbaceae bacterium]|nr:hypothetical protein [Desulfobulbaceae bacterium]